jgi:N-acetylmuramic acid 6-phosphate etherase
LRLLFEVDRDVIEKYREFAASGRANQMAETVVNSLKAGGKLFFTGCGSTGRLSIQLVSIWRDFWQKQKGSFPTAEDLEHRAHSVMAGGDFALIKAVEGFEDFTAFGKKQIADIGVGNGDVVFAITEGGETSFVIGTAWQGLEVGAKVYFVYNNPDVVLRDQVKRSREIIDEPGIEKINLTTGPMAITGSTRMQATSIQLCVLLTVLEMALRRLGLFPESKDVSQLPWDRIPAEFLARLEEMHTNLQSADFLSQLAKAVELEESVYRSGNKNNYFADRFGIDVLTDTTERSPTYCTPPFRKFDDTTATESWAFLFVPQEETSAAWERIIKRKPRCVEWNEAEVKKLAGDKAARTYETVQKISYSELMRFKVGIDGLPYRRLGAGCSAVGVVGESEKSLLLSPVGFVRAHLEGAAKAKAKTSIIFVGSKEAGREIADFTAGWIAEPLTVILEAPRNDFLLDGVTRAGLKMMLNAFSTCVMVRLGRVMGNYMIWVVPSNLKLIDRATRYIQRLTQMDYRKANELLFEVIEYVEPRMKADQAYPPVVGVSVMRARHNLGNESAEKRLLSKLRA